MDSCSAGLQHAVTGIHRVQRIARLEFRARRILGRDLVERGAEYGVRTIGRNEHHAIDIAHHPVACRDAHAGNLDRYVLLHHLGPPLVSSGPMPPWNTGKRIARMRATSRTKPSVTQPAAPWARAAMESSSPQGAIQSVGPPQASTGTSPGFRSSIKSISSAYGLLPGATVSVAT